MTARDCVLKIYTSDNYAHVRASVNPPSADFWLVRARLALGKASNGAAPMYMLYGAVVDDGARLRPASGISRRFSVNPGARLLPPRDQCKVNGARTATHA